MSKSTARGGWMVRSELRDIKPVVKMRNALERQRFFRRPAHDGDGFSWPHSYSGVFPNWIVQFSEVDGYATVFTTDPVSGKATPMKDLDGDLTEDAIE